MKAATLLLAIVMMVTSGTVTAQEIDVRQQQINCLASNIYYEARGESERGQIAVGLVTINRAKSKQFANSICDVVRQPKQFSWYHPSKIKSSGDRLFVRAKDIATMLYDEYYVANNYVDFVSGATHFHSTRIQPGWRNVKRVATIGSHVFYRTGR